MSLLWNFLSASCFPVNHNLQKFKCNINCQLLSCWIHFFLVSLLSRVFFTLLNSWNLYHRAWNWMIFKINEEQKKIHMLIKYHLLLIGKILLYSFFFSSWPYNILHNNNIKIYSNEYPYTVGERQRSIWTSAKYLFCMYFNMAYANLLGEWLIAPSWANILGWHEVERLYWINC